MSSDVLEPKEVAQLLKVSVRTVVRLAERGEIVAFKVGDLWRFHRADVDAYIEEQKRKQQQKKENKQKMIVKSKEGNGIRGG